MRYAIACVAICESEKAKAKGACDWFLMQFNRLMHQQHWIGIASWISYIGIGEAGRATIEMLSPWPAWWGEFWHSRQKYSRIFNCVTEMMNLIIWTKVNLQVSGTMNSFRWYPNHQKIIDTHCIIKYTIIYVPYDIKHTNPKPKLPNPDRFRVFVVTISYIASNNIHSFGIVQLTTWRGWRCE